jgi:putative flavoprotein involved in K+ transport
VSPAEQQTPQIESTGSSYRYYVAVVGAGQAGLAMGYFLARQGLRFVILEAEDSIGAPWRTRWDSLKLFTSRRYDALPGLDFPGDPSGYPSRDEVIAYLEQYADEFKLPVRSKSAVQSLRARDRGFVLELAGGETIEADQVVVATGPFQTPFVPPLANEFAPNVFQTHSTGYRRPTEVPEGVVLVVGGGNTGYQIAEELATTREVHLAVGARQMPLPQRLLGHDLFWWLEKLRLLEKNIDSRVGRRLSERETLIGSSPRGARRQGIELRPRLTAVSGRTATFADGSELKPDAVIWATGYRPDYSWIDPSITDERGRLRHRRGATDIPGLYFLGQQWQYTRGSALLGWVKDDAAYLADLVATRAGTAESDESTPAAASSVLA